MAAKKPIRPPYFSQEFAAWKHAKAAGWIAAIRHEGRSHYLGYFLDPLEGALAYDRAALAIHGEFAATNESLGLLP
jgi:hypothetical protein